LVSTLACKNRRNAMKRWVGSVLVSVLSLAVLTGCNRGGCGRRPQAEIPETAVIDELRIEIADLKIEQGREAAIARMKAVLSDPALAEYKPSIVEWLLDEYLREDPIGVVQDAYLELAAGDEVIASAGFRQVMQASGASTNVADVVAWYEKVLASGITDDAKAYVWDLRARAYAADGAIAPIAARIGEILALQPPTSAFRILQGVFGEGLRLEDFDGLDAVLGAIQPAAAEREDLAHLVLGVKADILMRKGMLVEAETFLLENADALGDRALSDRAASLLKPATAAASVELCERVVAWALAAGDERPETRRAVISEWVRMASKANDAGGFLARLTQALDGGCPPDQLLPSFNQGFYGVMMTRDATLQKTCLSIADRFKEMEALSQGQSQSLGLMMLDGAFYMQDFRRAYDLVDAGIPGQDEEWHTEIKDKVGAHLALQEGRFEDAIVLFRKHMDRVMAWEAPVVNPESGARMIKEAVLGFNEKRIGDIYAGMDGRGDDAQAAYARARDWYGKALEILEADSREHKDAASELAQVPVPAVAAE
jgi:hypothetical protein